MKKWQSLKDNIILVNLDKINNETELNELKVEILKMINNRKKVIKSKEQEEWWNIAPF